MSEHRPDPEAEPDPVDVVPAVTVDDELVAAFERLIPQLSTSSLPPTGAELTDIVENPATVLFLARVDGAIVGSLTLAFYRIPTGLKAWIEDVVVDDAVRGRGVGAALNQAALAEARRRGSKDVSLTSRPVARGSEPPLPSSRVRRPRDEHVPLHVLIRVGLVGGERQRASRSSAAWRTCQSRSSRARASAASTSSPSNGASARTARRRTAGLSPVAARIAGRPRSSPIAPSAATAASRTERVVGRSGEGDQPLEDGRAVRLVLAARPCRHLDDGRVVVVQRADEVDVGMVRGHLGSAPPDGAVGVGERPREHVVVEDADALQGAQRRCPHGRVVAVQSTPSRGGIAPVAGDGDVAPGGRGGHCLSRSVMVVTSQARPNAVTVASTTPITIARPEPATTAQIRRKMLGRL